MMKYFRLHNSCEPGEVGTYPQIQNAVVPTTVTDPNYISQFGFTKLPENTLAPVGLPDKKSKITDLMSTSFVGLENKLFVSDKLYNIICSYNETGLQFVETRLVYKKREHIKYWIIHPFQSMYLNLDFSETYFFYYPASFSDVKEQRFFEEETGLVNVQKNMTAGEFIKIEKVVFREKLQADFFCLKIVDGGVGFYVSEPLKEEILKAGCTGVVFTEPNTIYP